MTNIICFLLFAWWLLGSSFYLRASLVAGDGLLFKVYMFVWRGSFFCVFWYDICVWFLFVYPSYSLV
jgi:hypothetical protein